MPLVGAAPLPSPPTWRIARRPAPPQASFNDRLTALPAEMGSLPRLELLRCACCDIHELPPSFANLRSLAWVSLASNPLTGAKHPNYASSHLPKVKLEELELGRKLGGWAGGKGWYRSGGFVYGWVDGWLVVPGGW